MNVLWSVVQPVVPLRVFFHSIQCFFISSSVLVFFYGYLVFFMSEVNVINCMILCICNCN